MLVAGFTAMLLNPAVAKVQRRVPRRGLAVTIVTLWAALVFIGLAAAFGVPLVNGITHLADRLPGYVASAQHGSGWIGHLVARYHVQSWVQRNTPRLAGYAQSLAKPALTVGKGAVSVIIEMVTLFVLVLLLLLEGPKMWSWTLGQMTPGRRAAVTRVAADVSGKVTGYMFGNLLTSLIAGTVVFVTLLILGVPFPLLWGLWVALVDFLPMIGGALAGIPTVLFAFIAQGLTAGIVTAVVFAVYTQIENHVLNPVVMSKTVRINPLLVFIAVLVGASIGSLIGGIFGGFVAALLAIPTAGALQVLVKEVWQATAPDQPQESPAPAAEPATCGSRPRSASGGAVVSWYWLDDHVACSHHHPGTVGSAAGVRRTRLDPGELVVCCCSGGRPWTDDCSRGVPHGSSGGGSRRRLAWHRPGLCGGVGLARRGTGGTGRP